jgi:hypothetical protein
MMIFMLAVGITGGANRIYNGGYGEFSPTIAALDMAINAALIVWALFLVE